MITQRAQELYNRYNFGRFGLDRAKYNLPLLNLIRKVKSTDRLYDIGCGSGYWLGVYLEMGIAKEQITALDLSQANIDNLRMAGYNAFCGDLLQLPFAEKVSDFTICNGVLHHTRDPFLAFKELVRITKPGGYIFLNVYNKLNPWFYLVHKATFPIRYIYWNWTKKIVNIIYPASKIFFQPLAYLLFRKFLDDESGMALFMDQVITPRAFLFSGSKISSYAKQCNCQVEGLSYNSLLCLMISAQIKVKDA